jgi:prepilin-type N-terminal cleavage/methylation domain-containing protein
VRRRAFTLIELLIVVAIIAILAAIAVPNFLEAQTRAKVSRSKSDMRTIATALESYAVDNGKYSTDAGNGQTVGTQPMWRPYGNSGPADPRANFSIGFELTTPVSYVSSLAPLVDVFKLQSMWRYQDNTATSGRQYYNFFDIALREQMGAGPFTTTKNLCGLWVLFGAGPDTFVNNIPGGTDFSNANNIPNGRNYDPTNGTVSRGDIYRTQKYGDGMPETTNL